MTFKCRWNAYSLLTFFYGLAFNVFADTNPCGGDSALLSIIDRPTAADSACVVPYKNAVLEAGYEYQQLTHSAGYNQNFPEAELRLGLPANNEFFFVLPNYIHQTQSGFDATTMGIKHEIGYTQHWLAAVEGSLTPPSGSNAFGSHGLGATFNGIITYIFNSQVSFTFLLGASTQTQSSFNGGQRFTSINPDMVLSILATQKIDFFAEIYGQSKTAPEEGSGFNFDGGIVYLLTPNFSIDFEIGQRISGNLSGFNHYIGTGIGILF